MTESEYNSVLSDTNNILLSSLSSIPLNLSSSPTSPTSPSLSLPSSLSSSTDLDMMNIDLPKRLSSSQEDGFRIDRTLARDFENFLQRSGIKKS